MRLRVETSLGNNDTKMPAYSRGVLVSRDLQVISRDENLLNQGHGSLAPLWPSPNIVGFLSGTYSEDFCPPWGRHCKTTTEDDDFMRGGTRQLDIFPLRAQHESSSFPNTRCPLSNKLYNCIFSGFPYRRWSVKITMKIMDESGPSLPWYAGDIYYWLEFIVNVSRVFSSENCLRCTIRFKHLLALVSA